jgi:hypothetical protein
VLVVFCQKAPDTGSDPFSDRAAPRSLTLRGCGAMIAARRAENNHAKGMD